LKNRKGRKNVILPCSLSVCLMCYTSGVVLILSSAKSGFNRKGSRYIRPNRRPCATFAHRSPATAKTFQKNSRASGLLPGIKENTFE